PHGTAISDLPGRRDARGARLSSRSEGRACNLPPMRRPFALLFLAALVGVSPSIAADDPGGAPPDAKDESTPDYLKALDLQRKGKWKEAQKAFHDVTTKYPNSVHASDCEMRGGDNCYMGCVKL